MKFGAFVRSLVVGFLLVVPSVYSQIGASLNFNGVDGNVTVSNFNTLGVSSEVTVEFWEVVTSASRVQLGFVLNPDTVTNRLAAAVPFSDGKVYWDFGDASTINSASNGRLVCTNGTFTGAWHHFAFVGSGSGKVMQVYQDGSLIGSKVLGIGAKGFVLTNCALQIGGGGGTNFQGKIDEFRIWNVARSASQIQSSMNQFLTGTESGLVLYYPFSESSGLTTTNLKSGGINGTLMNGVSWVADTVSVSAATAQVLNNTAIFSTPLTPNGTPVNVLIRYGTDPNAVSNPSLLTNFTATVPVGYFRSSIFVTNTASGLTGNTTYYYQSYVTAGTNVFTNAVQSFTTSKVIAFDQSYGWLENAMPTNLLSALSVVGSITNFSIVQNPLHGQLILASGFTNNGMWQYLPRITNFFGSDFFTFRVVAGGITSAPARVTINVTNVNTAPTAHDQYLKTRPGQSIPVTLTADDDYDYMRFTTNGGVNTHFSPNISALGLHYILASSPTNGTLTTNADSGYISPDLTYTPTAGLSNVFDSFTFRATDGSVTSAVATVMVRIGNYNAGTNYFSSFFGTNLTHYLDVPLANKGTIRPGYESMALSPTNGIVSIGASTNVTNGRTDDGLIQLNLSAPQFLDRIGCSNLFVLANRSFTNLWINNNGVVSFEQAVPGYTPNPFPVGEGALVAPYWEDVDTTATNKGGIVTLGRGYAYGRQSTIVTWNDVGSYSQSTTGLNRFQLVIIDRSDIGDGQVEIEFNYEYAETLYGALSQNVIAQLGFDGGDMMSYFSLPGSRTAAVTNVITTSNCGVPGRFRYYPSSLVIESSTNGMQAPYWLSQSDLLLQGDVMMPLMGLTPSVFAIFSVTNGVTNFFTNVTAVSSVTYPTNFLPVTAIVSNVWPDGQYIFRLTNAASQFSSANLLFERPKLASLIANSLTLTPSFSPNISNYTAAAFVGTTVTVTPTLMDPAYLLQARFNTNSPNGLIASGGASVPYILTNGFPSTNVVSVDIIATNGNVVRTYTINVVTLPNTESRLSALSFGGGAISPSFSPNQTTNYTVTVPSSFGSTLVSATPMAFQANSITYSDNGGGFTSNNPCALNLGTNNIVVRCVAENTNYTTQYAVTVIRTPDTNFTLAAINLSAGTLSPAFNPGISQYSATVGLLVTNITVGALTTYSNATVQINGGAFALQTNAATIPLVFGTNVIPITVVAENGVLKNYTVTVLRTPPVANTLGAVVVSTNAIMKGSFDAVNLPTKVYFQYGLTTSYGSSSPTNQVMATSSALTLNGVNQYVRTTNRITNDFTIEFWFKSAQNAGFSGSGWNNGMGLVDGQVSGGTNGFGVSFGGGRIMFGVGYPDTTIRSGPLADNNWHHVAATRSTGAMELFIDGLSVANTNSGNAGALDPVANLMIGALAFTNNFFQGSIDELRIWNTARTPVQIQQNADQSMSGNEPGLVNYFHFDEGTGLVTADFSSQGGTGVLSNNPVWTTVTAVTNYSAMAFNLSRSLSGGYHYRIVAETAGGVYQGADQFFQVQPEAPIVLTTSATVTNSVSAVLNVSLNPAGSATGVRFVWGTNDVFGKATDSTSWISVGGGDSTVTTNLVLTGLRPATDYHFWVQATNFFTVVNGSSSQGSNTVFTTLTPVINSISPSNGPTVGSTLVTMNGSYLGTSGVPFVGGVPCTISSYNNTQVKFLTPPGVGNNQAVTLSIEGSGYTATSPTSFNYDRPVLTSVEPNHGPTVGGISITLIGTNFGNQISAASVMIGGQPATVTSCNHTQIVCQLPAGQGANKAVVVTVGGQTNLVVGTFNYDGPTINNVAPNIGPASGGIEITLAGSNFGTNGTLSFNGQPITPTSYDHSQIKFMLPAGQGLSNAIVLNVGGQISAPSYFNYYGPSITFVSPNHGPTFGNGETITLTGTNFGTSGTVTFNGQGVVLLSYIDSQIKFLQPSGQGTNNSIVVVASGQSSAPASFSFDGPTITNVSPSIGPAAGGIEIILTGSNFGTNGTLTFNGQPVSPTIYFDSQIRFMLPAGQGVSNAIVLNVSGQASSPAYFNYTAPSITLVSPNHGATIGGSEITLTGTNFGTSGTVTFDGQTLPTTSYNNTQIKFTLPSGQGTGKSIVVGVSGQNSSAATFSYDGPTITNVLPNTGPTAGGVEITLNGSNFGTNGTVTFDGQTQPTTSYNNTQIKFTLPSGQGTGKSIVVGVSGQNSSAATFNYEGPTITNVSPNLGPAAGGVEITLNGSNFGTNGTVTFNGDAVATTSYTNNQIKFVLPAGQGTGNAIVVVVAGQLSSPALFSYAGPSITQISPNHGPTLGGIEITLTGTNFGTNGTLTFDGQTQSTTSYDNTQIKFVLPAGQGIDRPIAVTASGQNSSAATFSYDGPTITNVSPSTGPVAGGIPITLTGSNFGTNGTVSIDGQSCTISFYSHNLIICTLPAGQGLNKTVTVQTGTQTSNAKLFGYYGAPSATTLGADGTASKVYGSVNPNGAETSVYFQYGPDTSYGNLSATNILPVADEVLFVTNVLTDLESGAVYHYRVVAENLAGTNYGADMVFTNVPSADIAVSVSASPEPVGLGTNLTYTVTVTNRGPNPSGAIWLTNTLSPNVDFSSASDGGVLSSGTVVYNFEGLPVGESTNVSIVVIPSTLSDITNIVSIQSDLLDTNLANNIAIVVSSGQPSILSQPLARTNDAGTTATFDVVVHGGAVAFQWLKNGNPIADGGTVSGAMTPSLTLSNVLAVDAGDYSLVVSNSAGAVTSFAASLTVIDPYIANPPANQTITNGGTINLSVNAIGTGPLKYQWLKNGVAIAKQTNSVFQKVKATTGDAGVYSVRVTNALNSVALSAGATVAVDLPLSIKTQPANVQKTYGQVRLAKFTASTGGNNQTYQWFKNGSAISGATLSVYTVPVVTNLPSSPDFYSVTVANGSYSVTSSNATLTSIVDTNMPSVSITTPKAIGYSDPTVSNYSFGIGGKAQDNAQVTNVLWSMNGTAFQSLVLTSNDSTVFWTNVVTVQPGTNILQVYAVDYSGLRSKTNVVKFFYDVRSSFVLFTNNLPDVPGVLNFVKPTFNKTLGTNDGSAPLLVGRSYQLTALNVFTNGYILTNWTFTSATNSVELVLETNKLALSYVMRSNMTIYANFITNPFTVYKGTYNGLFHEADQIRHQTAGFITLSTTERFGYSGKLLLDGDSVPFSGVFNIDGKATNTISRVKLAKDNLQVKLALDFAGGTQTVTGSVANVTAGWTAEILADRYVWNATSNPATNYATNYTIAIPGFDDNAIGPVGYGYALVSVNSAGTVRAAGTASDGAVISQTTMLSQSGRWPFFAPLYSDSLDIVAGKPVTRTRGELIGWLDFAPNTNAFAENTNLAPVGRIDWIKTVATGNNWTAGFTNEVDVLASMERTPPAGEMLCGQYTNFLAVLSSGGLSSSITNLVTLATNNSFVVNTKRTNDPVYTNKFAATLNKMTGFISGGFTNETSAGKSISWKGVLLQDYNNGYGFFTNNVVTNGSGKVNLLPFFSP